MPFFGQINKSVVIILTKAANAVIIKPQNGVQVVNNFAHLARFFFYQEFCKRFQKHSHPVATFSETVRLQPWFRLHQFMKVRRIPL